MIYKIAKIIACSLIKHNYLADNDRELFEYGFFLVLSQLMYFSTCLILGLIFGCILECIIFYIAFNLLRKYSGGFHASTELRCFVFSSLSIFFSVVCISKLQSIDLNIILVTLLAISSLVIVVFSPLDTKEKPLTHEERIKYRKYSLIIFSVALIICMVGFVKAKVLGLPIFVAIVLESIFLIFGKVKQIHLNAIATNKIIN